MTVGLPLRRWYLRMRREAEALDEAGIASALRYRQEQEPGTALPPLSASLVARLAAAGYTAREDLEGATADELADEAGLARSEARGVLAALGS